MKTLLLSLIIIQILFSCDTDSEENICSNAKFVFLNQNGEDIFSSKTSNHLNLLSFKAFANDSISRLNFIDTVNGMNVFDIWLYGEIEKEGITYLKFENDIDTILTKFGESDGSLFISEIYYNDSLIEKNNSTGECGNQVIHKIMIK